MIRQLHRILLSIGLVAVIFVAASPAPAVAQWHGHGRVFVSFGGYWPYPYWGPYWGPGWGPYFGFGWGYPWGGPYPFGPYGPYPYYGWDPLSGSARLQVTPREAKVYVDGYAAGLTPNPCMRCNGAFRFDALAAFAERIGADVLWTGHYARVVERNGIRLIGRAADPTKDQSYMLATVDPALLDRAQKSTGQGITRTVHRGLELVAAADVYKKLRALRGKVAVSLDVEKLREDRS